MGSALIPENVRYAAVQSVYDVLERIYRDVLLHRLDALKR